MTHHTHSTPHPAPDAQLPSDASGETHTEAGALLPCPFCGNADIRPSYVTGAVFCEECGTDGPRSPFWDGDWNTRAERAEAQLAAMTAERDALVGAASVVKNCTIDLRGAGYDCVDLDGDVMTGNYGEGDKVMCCGPRVYLDGLHILGPAALDHMLAQAKAEGRKEGLEEVRAEVATRRTLLNRQMETLDISREDAIYGICDAILAAAQKEAGK